MKVLLTSDYGCYELTPVNKKIARKLKRNTGEESLLFQTDYDFPGLARSLGWRGKIGREKCEHRGTDGTVNCPDCGRKAIEFITAASEWLDNRCNHVFVKPVEDYFGL